MYAANQPLVAIDPSGLLWTWAEVRPILELTHAGRSALLTANFRPPIKLSSQRGGDYGFVEPLPNDGGPWTEFNLEVLNNAETSSEMAAGIYVHEAEHVRQLRNTVRQHQTKLRTESVTVSSFRRYAFEVIAEAALYDHLDQLEALSPEWRIRLIRTAPQLRRRRRRFDSDGLKDFNVWIFSKWNYSESLTIPCQTKLPLPVNPAQTPEEAGQ